MRKGRGLVEMDIFNELMKISGTRTLLLDNVTNHRENPKTGKLCAEIHEDAWPEIKQAIANWRRIKNGKSQKKFIPTPAKSTGKSFSPKETSNSKESLRIQKLRNLKPGDKFAYKNDGFGTTSYEDGSDAVEIKKGKLFTETFSSKGMKWSNGTWEFNGGFGMTTSIVLLEDVPKGELNKK